MSTEEGWGRRTGEVDHRRSVRGSLAILLMASFVVLGGCGGDTADTSLEETTSAVTTDQELEPAVPAMEEPATIADIFPEGTGRDIVLNNCASCHAVACAAIGQRPAGRWDDLREAHREHVPSLSDEDLTTAFAYLRENFSDQQPEPNVPAQFLERGCTPF